MSKTIRLALVVAFILFAVAIIWVIIANRRHNQAKRNDEQANTPTLVGQPAAVTTPASATPAENTAPSTTAATPPKAKPQKRIVVIEETIVETPVSIGAWASAGADNKGSWAEAHAE